MGALRYLIGVLDIFDRCPGNIGSLFWKYLIFALEIFDRCPLNI